MNTEITHILSLLAVLRSFWYLKELEYWFRFVFYWPKTVLLFRHL